LSPIRTYVPGEFVPDAIVKQFYCPVCGGELTQSDFDTPERDYYCPHCSTRQTPSAGSQGAGLPYHS
jgi:rubredoxin